MKKSVSHDHDVFQQKLIYDNKNAFGFPRRKVYMRKLRKCFVNYSNKNRPHSKMKS